MYTSVECVFTVMCLVEILQQGMVGLFKIDWRSSDSAASKVEGFQTVGILFFFILPFLYSYRCTFVQSKTVFWTRVEATQQASLALAMSAGVAPPPGWTPPPTGRSIG